EMALSTGMWTERPNPLSFPLGDGGVFAAYLAEPLIREHATWAFEYQGFKDFGKQLLDATIWRYPVLAVTGVFKRLLLLVVRLPDIAQPIAAVSPWFVRMSQIAIVGTLLLALLVVWFPSRWHFEGPLIVIPLWNVLGLELLTHLIH